ncbi:hypothetical protein [Enterovibrio norvegicus]|uniref:hypothetical protein n=1 Tax=Enterovibrio norvegicus TaxID=188144 RepID=UPI00352F5537
MDVFSFLTTQGESIPLADTPHPNAGREVFLLQPNGTLALGEKSYAGYGYFGGIDCFAWLGKMNGGQDAAHLCFHSDAQQLRELAINIAFDDSGSYAPELVHYPLKFSFNKDAVYEQEPASHTCRYHGRYYPSNQPERHFQIRVIELTMADEFTLTETGLGGINQYLSIDDAEARTLLDGCQFDVSEAIVLKSVRRGLANSNFIAAQTLFDASEGSYSLNVEHEKYGKGFALIEVTPCKQTQR